MSSSTKARFSAFKIPKIPEISMPLSHVWLIFLLIFPSLPAISAPVPAPTQTVDLSEVRTAAWDAVSAIAESDGVPFSANLITGNTVEGFAS